VSPRARRRAVCTSCGHVKPCEDHHPGREVAAPDVTVPECPGDHRVLTKRAERAGMFRVSRPRTPLERVSWIIVGAFDTVERVRIGDDRSNQRVAATFRLMTRYAVLALGALDQASSPEQLFGPDPIVNTPRTFRGKRPSSRPEWRAKNPPPQQHDLVRITTLFQMFIGVQLAIFGEDVEGIGAIDVSTLATRLDELGEEGPTDVVLSVIDQARPILARAVRARSVAEFASFGDSFGRFGVFCQRTVTLLRDLSSAGDRDEALAIVSGYWAWCERAGPLVGEDSPDGAEPSPGRGTGVHHPTPS
jgi:hypothetical protein